MPVERSRARSCCTVGRSSSLPGCVVIKRRMAFARVWPIPPIRTSTPCTRSAAASGRATRSDATAAEAARRTRAARRTYSKRLAQVKSSRAPTPACPPSSRSSGHGIDVVSGMRALGLIARAGLVAGLVVVRAVDQLFALGRVAMRWPSRVESAAGLRSVGRAAFLRRLALHGRTSSDHGARRRKASQAPGRNALARSVCWLASSRPTRRRTLRSKGEALRQLLVCTIEQMSLYDLIRKRRDRIIAIWREEGARVAAGDSMPARELVDTLPVYLDELAASLEAEACGQPQPVSGQLAATHGVTRLQLGFAPHELIREYGLLRDAILAAANEDGYEPPREELVSLSRCLFTSISASVAAYVREHEAVLQRQASDHLA